MYRGESGSKCKGEAGTAWQGDEKPQKQEEGWVVVAVGLLKASKKGPHGLHVDHPALGGIIASVFLKLKCSCVCVGVCRFGENSYMRGIACLTLSLCHFSDQPDPLQLLPHVQEKNMWTRCLLSPTGRKTAGNVREKNPSMLIFPSALAGTCDRSCMWNSFHEGKGAGSR